MRSVLEYLEKTADENSKKIAVIEEDKKCTYLELLEKSKRVFDMADVHIIMPSFLFEGSLEGHNP